MEIFLTALLCVCLILLALSAYWINQAAQALKNCGESYQKLFENTTKQ